MSNYDDLPEDVFALAEWFPILRHLRGMAKSSSGLAVLQVRVIVDEFGSPMLWNTPTIDKLLPRATRDEALSELLSKLTEG
jgi:hypothetical protein